MKGNLVKKIQISADCYIKIGPDCDGKPGVAVYTFNEKRVTLKPETAVLLGEAVYQFVQKKSSKIVATTKNASNQT